MTILETRNVTKQFGELTAVNTVDLTVERNEIHSIIGPNGAGKSTLFNCISGLLRPDGGSVYFQGEDITGLPPREIVQRGLSRSFQIEDLFDGLTVRENVRLAAQVLDERNDSIWRRAESLSEPGRKAAEILDDIGLTEHANLRADALSHGDRRKLEIGLAIAVDPDLFLLDEPTAGIDKDGSVQTVKLIQRIADERNITTVLIEHDLEIVMGISDTITVLTEGSVLATGSADEIQADPEVREAYIGTEVV